MTVTHSGPRTVIYCPDCILQAVQPAATLDFGSLGPALTAALAQVSEQVRPGCFSAVPTEPFLKLFACGAQAQMQCPAPCRGTHAGEPGLPCI